MVKSALRILGQNRKYILGIIAAVWVCGITTAAVIAAVPDTDGAIHGCYRKTAGLTDPKGALRVVDGQSCNSNENPVNWNAAGSGSAPVVLKDANGQVLGDLIDYVPILNQNNPNPQEPQMKVYNHTLNRIVEISYTSLGSEQKIEYGTWGLLAFQSSDCTGQAYIFSAPTFAAKTTLYHSYENGGPRTYYVVSDNASPTTVNIGSILNSGSCNANDPSPTEVYAATPVTLPFTTPIATPFKF